MAAFVESVSDQTVEVSYMASLRFIVSSFHRSGLKVELPTLEKFE